MCVSHDRCGGRISVTFDSSLCPAVAVGQILFWVAFCALFLLSCCWPLALSTPGNSVVATLLDLWISAIGRIASTIFGYTP
ncbi:uncharacterized protein LY79DRAFT_569976 [Colletotrichum navitas]|uniref:Uncharacterized protein n=1 Tax=Colletotrichum navitas TaxID=681940 RepID=A0AAD8PMX5_9PEZI|nr:uncharacterized protein LY79DRAFT_569976 [Colletotrichum navitas]KAK1572677.1 hypothetical protein LY79DRAFT_569976 [Colletotrichum navitas]